MALEHRRRPVLRLVGCLGGAVLVAASGLWLFARRWQDEVGTYSFAPDVEVRLFIESDIDNPPSYFYEIRRSGRLVTPPTFLDVVSDRDEPTEARQASSADGSVIAVWTDRFTILFDLPSGESWPRLRDDESISQPAAKARWRERADRVRLDHPELPVPAPMS